MAYQQTIDSTRNLSIYFLVGRLHEVEHVLQAHLGIGKLGQLLRILLCILISHLPKLLLSD